MQSQKKIERRIFKISNSYQKFIFETETNFLKRLLRLIYHLIRNISLLTPKIIKEIDKTLSDLSDSQERYSLVVLRDLILFYRPRILSTFRKKGKDKVRFPDGTLKSIPETEYYLLYSDKTVESSVLNEYIRIKQLHAFDNMSIVHRMQNYSRKGGYSSYIELFNQNSDLNPNKLKQTCYRILEETMTTYKSLLEKLLAFFYNKTIEVSTLSDLWNLITEQFHFTKKLEPKSLQNLFFDLPVVKYLCPNPSQSFQVEYNTRQFLTGVVTDQNRNRIRIQLGSIHEAMGLHGVFHEFGHGIHLINIGQEKNRSFSHFGDSATTETIAFLFESLLLEEDFISKISLKDENQKQIYKEFRNFRWLYRLRKSALQFIIRYDILSHTQKVEINNLERIQAKMRSLYNKFFLIDHPCYDFMDNINENFFLDANYLRAYLVCFNLRSLLQAKFGNKWWTTEETGKFLKDHYLKNGFNRLLRDILPDSIKDSYDPLALIRTFMTVIS